MTANEPLQFAPVDWEQTINSLTNSERDVLRRQLEGLATCAGKLAAYLDERHGNGCGDQGHLKAVKAANRAGKKIWCGAFGYNGFHNLTI